MIGSDPVRASDPPNDSQAATEPAAEIVRLADAPRAEREALERMLESNSWTLRAIATMRLEQFECDASRARLEQMLDDPDWQVRAFAVTVLARRRIDLGDVPFSEEENPRVMRAVLRARYLVNEDRLERGVRTLSRSSSRSDQLLAAELGSLSQREELQELATEMTRKVILRMDRIECGSLSPRLALITGQHDMRRSVRWRLWLRKVGRSLELKRVFIVDESERPPDPFLIARLPPERFAALEDYIARLSMRDVDLAICLDCTASMSGELAAAQGGIDDLMLFVGDVVRTLRVGIVAYRDRRDRDFETKAWDFTSDIAQARDFLWQFEARGGGDHRESVYEALHLAYTKLSWNPQHVRALVLVGDAPPHVGYGGRSAEMARRAAANDLTTHTIQCSNEPVEHFAEIAEAGNGQCVSLANDDALIGELAGLAIGDAYAEEIREFFRVYLVLCR